jgi:uncharacterized protein
MKPALHHPLEEFCKSVEGNDLFGELERNFPLIFRNKKAPDGEIASWAASLPRLCDVLRRVESGNGIEVAIEIGVPYSEKRIDAALFGHSQAGDPCMLLVELKQWSKLEPPREGQLYIGMGGGLVEVDHPSEQVYRYQGYLSKYLRACYNEPRVKLVSCAYVHNYPTRTGSLYDPLFAEHIARAPLFCRGDAGLFADFIREHVGAGGGAEIRRRIWSEGCGPSLVLKEHAADLMYSQNVFTLLGEQLHAHKQILSAVKKARRDGGKEIILVEGGPGTGKSLIALDAFATMREKFKTFLVTGSAALTGGLRELLPSEFAHYIRFTDYFWDFAQNSVDVLIVDEAHRIRAKSIPRVPTEQRPRISQLEELIRAARVLVLFMDVNQIIDPDEVGDPKRVEELAGELDIRFRRLELRSQFRCNGSGEYLNWCDHLFDLRKTGDFQPLNTPSDFDFQVMDSPHELLAWVRAKNDAVPDSARLVAGWCWPWSDPREDGTLVDDIRIGDFAFPWERKNKSRPGPDTPQARHWAVKHQGMGQAGTVYSIQSYEFRHIAVLMGPDLIICNDRWVATPRANYQDSLSSKPPEVASDYFRRIYRTLFTRALVSIRVYSVDEGTREFIRSKLSPIPE